LKQVAKKFGGAILIVASLFMLISILSCGKTAGGKKKGNNVDNNKPSEDPELTLDELKIGEKKADITKTPYEIEVENAVKKLEPKDINAMFKYGNKTTAEKVDISKIEGVTELKENVAVVLTLKIDAVKGKHKEWTKQLKVTRKKASEPPKPQPANGYTLEWSFSSEQGDITVKYAEKDDEDKEDKLVTVNNAKIELKPNPSATKVVKDKWVYLRLKPKKGYKYHSFAIKKEAEGSAGQPLPMEKNDAKGFPKALKDKGFQVRFKMPDFNVRIYPEAVKEETGKKIKWDNDVKLGMLGVRYVNANEKHDVSKYNEVGNDSTLVKKGSWVYVSWNNNPPLCEKNLNGLKIKAKCKPNLMLDSNVPSNLKDSDPNFKGFFEMPDCEVEIEIILKD